MAGTSLSAAADCQQNFPLERFAWLQSWHPRWGPPDGPRAPSRYRFGMGITHFCDACGVTVEGVDLASLGPAR
jgi:hypothetical protein